MFLSKRAAEEPQVSLTDSERQLFDILRAAIDEYNLGTTVRVAGGWVRDRILNKVSKDIDIAVDNMTGSKFAEYVQRYADAHGLDVSSGLIAAKPEQGKNLETAVIHLLGEEIEVVNLRDEEYDEESRKPRVVITDSPIKDAFRRDLTINSLFYNIHTGQVEDYTGDGINDIREGVIRTPTTTPENEAEVGRKITPKEIFMDDPLRVLRAVRFANRYGFEVKDELIEAAKDPDVQEAFRRKITNERVQLEMEKIMKERKSPRYALELIRDWGYRNEVIPLQKGFSEYEMDQQSKHHVFNVWDHTMETLDHLNDILEDKDIDASGRYLLNWAALLHDIGKLDPEIKKTEQLADKIEATYHGHEAASAKAADYLLRNHMKGTASDDIKRIMSLIERAGDAGTLQRLVESGELSDKAIGKFLRKFVKNFEDDWNMSLYLSMADSFAHKTKEEQSPERMKYWEALQQRITDMPSGTATMKPIIDGRELMQMFGRKGGPWMANINKAMIDWQLGNPTATKEQAMEWAKQYYVSAGLDKIASGISKRDLNVSFPLEKYATMVAERIANR